MIPINTTMITNLSDLTKAQMGVSAYGVNLNLTNSESCRVLYEALVDNYPCMREKYCTPFGTTQGAFIIAEVFILLLVIYGTYYFTMRHIEKQQEKAKNGKSDMRKS